MKQWWQYQVVRYQEAELPSTNVAIWVATPEALSFESDTLYYPKVNRTLLSKYGPQRHFQVVQFLGRMTKELKRGEFWVWWQADVPEEVHRLFRTSEPCLMAEPLDDWPKLLLERYVLSPETV